MKSIHKEITSNRPRPRYWDANPKYSSYIYVTLEYEVWLKIGVENEKVIDGINSTLFNRFQ